VRVSGTGGTSLSGEPLRAGEVLPALVESTLEAGAEVRFAVDGRSMLPFIRPGDLVRLRPAAGSEPRLGDVVAIRGMPKGGLLVHRVVRVRDGMFLLRGDNTSMANGEHSRAGILGVVGSVERDGRSVRYGAGRWRALVALAVRTGVMLLFNRARLKFPLGATRLREHKGDDGNE
jgi:phage repressor protein C with HTH and peptisase S24 domain